MKVTSSILLSKAAENLDLDKENSGRHRTEKDMLKIFRNPSE